MDSYKLVTDVSASPIDASGAELVASRTLAAGTQVTVNPSQDVLQQRASGGNVAVHAPDGNVYAVPASALTVDDSAASPTKLYAIVGIAVVLVAFMYWNTNRR